MFEITLSAHVYRSIVVAAKLMDKVKTLLSILILPRRLIIHASVAQFNVLGFVIGYISMLQNVGIFNVHEDVFCSITENAVHLNSSTGSAGKRLGEFETR